MEEETSLASWVEELLQKRRRLLKALEEAYRVRNSLQRKVDELSEELEKEKKETARLRLLILKG